MLTTNPLQFLLATSSCHGVLGRAVSPGRGGCGGRRARGLPTAQGLPPARMGNVLLRSQGPTSHAFLSNLPNTTEQYRITKMKKYALSTQQHRRGSSYCSSPIRHCGAFMLPLINPAELFTVPQAAHHHKHPHAQQTAVTQLSNRCAFSQAPRRASSYRVQRCVTSAGRAPAQRAVLAGLAARGMARGTATTELIAHQFCYPQNLSADSSGIALGYFRNTLLFLNDHGK